jgi:hypothetical protein
MGRLSANNSQSAASAPMREFRGLLFTTGEMGSCLSVGGDRVTFTPDDMGERVRLVNASDVLEMSL